LIVYLDTSVLIRWLFKSQNIYPKFNQWEQCYSSDLLWIESNRVLNRIKLENKINDQDYAYLKSLLTDFYNSIHIIELDDQVKNRASELFPTAVGTLDAIHISSAILCKKEFEIPELTLLTHDHQMATAAVAVGLKVAGVELIESKTSF
jgi:predicted nucleic acid-binding protein